MIVFQFWLKEESYRISSLVIISQPIVWESVESPCWSRNEFVSRLEKKFIHIF